MLWVYCVYLDVVNASSSAAAAAADAPPPPPGALDACDVLWRFFTVLALWPWPLPFNTQNMDAIVDRHPDRFNAAAIDGSIGPPRLFSAAALNGSMGRFLFTNVVVPLPCTEGTGRFWNMTQAVTPANQRFITREAWIATRHRIVPGSVAEYRDEMRRFSLACLVDPAGHRVVRWPLYLSIAFPADAPRDWQGIVASRLIPTIVPQLERSGFVPRPLCCDRPAYVVLLWPRDAVWSTKNHRELILPLGERLCPSILASLHSAYVMLLSNSIHRDRPLPPFERLLPLLDLHMCDL